ncbi:MAG: outer membrane protein transport protein [Ignavibacteriales bacterium]|nr:outer membrane protein transport protein [Ignavibacteriales bacterium]
MKKLLTLLLVCSIFAGSTYAGGFQTGTQNARAMGMGNSFVGMALDASSIYYNPAGLTNIRGFNLVAGTTLIMPTVDFTGPNPLTTKTTTVARTFTPINFYGAYTLDDGWTVGIGVYNPFGLGSEWPDGWIGKSLAVKTELRTFYFNPTVAYKVNEYFSVGAGFSYVISDVTFLQAFDVPAIPLAPGVSLPAVQNAKVTLEGKGDPGFTFNFGFLFKPNDVISFGFSYRHSVELNFSGDLTFTDLPAKPTGFPIGHSDLFPSGKGKATLTMPYDLRAGVSFNATKDFTINADLMFIGWESYKNLIVDFDKNTSVWKDVLSPKQWENTFGFKFGGEYRIKDLALRAGYVYDGSPIPSKYMDPSLPGANRNEFTLGVGYQFTPNIRFDAAYQFISFSNTISDSKIPFNGQYENSTNLFGFNLGFNF